MVPKYLLMDSTVFTLVARKAANLLILNSLVGYGVILLNLQNSKYHLFRDSLFRCMPGALDVHTKYSSSCSMCLLLLLMSSTKTIQMKKSLVHVRLICVSNYYPSFFLLYAVALPPDTIMTEHQAGCWHDLRQS